MRKLKLFSLLAGLLLSVGTMYADILVESGNCGAQDDNLIYYLYRSSDPGPTSYYLVIEGSGAMADYADSNKAPWCTGLRSAQLKSVELPNGLTHIGDYAFHSCSAITTIDIPNTVTSIGKFCFYYCSGLQSIGLSTSLESIGNFAFDYCTALPGITIPASVNSIGEGITKRCYSMYSIAVENGNQTYKSEGNAIIEKATGKLIAGCNSTEIPNTVTRIAKYAFCELVDPNHIENALTSITIPASVTYIENSSFYYSCDRVTCITVLATTPPTFEYKASEAFTALGIKVQDIPVQVPFESVDAYKNTDANKWSWFNSIKNPMVGVVGEEPQEIHWKIESCTGVMTVYGSGEMPFSSYMEEEDIPWHEFRNQITSVIIGNGITKIAAHAFSNCPYLESVTFEPTSSVEEIGNEAFAYCPNLTHITLPASLTNLGVDPFYGSDNLANLNFKSVTPPFSSTFYLPHGIRITYPDGSDQAYANKACASGINAAIWWNNLYNADTDAHAPIPQGSGTSGDVTWDFSMAYKLDRIDLLNDNFEDLMGTLTISGNGEMGEYSYGSSVAEDYKNFVDAIVIEDGVTKITEYAFFDFTHVRTVNIPASVTVIESNAFLNCGEITYGVSVYCTANPATLNWEDAEHNAFYNVSNYDPDQARMLAAHCYVPAQYIAGYQAKTDVNVVFVPSGLSDISDAETINGILTELNGEVVEEATITRPVPRDGFFFTLCVPFDISASDISISTLGDAEIMVFEDAEFTGDVINAYFTRTYGGIEAGKPYFVRFPISTSLDKLDFSNVTVRNIDPIPVKRGNVTMIGTYVPKHLEQQSSATDGEGLLFLVSENQLKWPEVAGDIKPFRCYFKVTLGSGAGAPRRGTPARIIVRDNSTTGIDNLQSAEVFEGKLLENGQLVIFRNGMKYNAAGQIVK